MTLHLSELTSYAFQGVFDGNGVNFDLTINKSTLDYQGLFGYASDVNTEIKNFSVSGSVNGRNQVGSALRIYTVVL